MSKVHKIFKDVEVGTKFYIKRTPDTCSADSISMVKVCNQFADSIEWGKSDINPDQPCWIYV